MYINNIFIKSTNTYTHLTNTYSVSNKFLQSYNHLKKLKQATSAYKCITVYLLKRIHKTNN